MTRRLQNWLEGYLDYTDHLSTTELFRKWTGISLIAATLQRRTWVHTKGQDLYPNLYIALVGPPGSGKTVQSSFAQELFGEIGKQHYLAPSSVSRASLSDALKDAHINFIDKNMKSVEFNSLYIISNELSSLIPAYDNDFMGTLTEIYDGKRYAEKKRTKELDYMMKHPQLNLLAATTPSYLNSIMPEGAWDQGFISRVILVPSGNAELSDLFATSISKETQYKALLADLKTIASLYGVMKFLPDAASAILNWYYAHNPPVPDHPKLQHYNTRRTAHVLKLCQIASVCRGDSLNISLEDYQTALGWLLEVEALMPDIFKGMAQGGDARAMEDCWHYCYTAYVKEKKPISQVRVWNFLSQRVPSNKVEYVIKAMVVSGLLVKELDSYKPLTRH